MLISDWSSDVCSSDLLAYLQAAARGLALRDQFSQQTGIGLDILDHLRLDTHSLTIALLRRLPLRLRRRQHLVAGHRGVEHVWELFAPCRFGRGEIEEIGRASCRERVCK